MPDSYWTSPRKTLEERYVRVGDVDSDLRELLVDLTSAVQRGAPLTEAHRALIAAFSAAAAGRPFDADWARARNRRLADEVLTHPQARELRASLTPAVAAIVEEANTKATPDVLTLEELLETALARLRR